MSYQSNRTGKEVDRLLDKIDNLEVEGILTEGYMPMMREFSDDFNDDFAR